MKKNFIMVGLMFIISVTNLAAQDSIQVSAATRRAFNASFQGAQNVQWIALPKGIREAKFYYKRNACIAYFDKEGTLIQSGRRIKDLNHLPLSVQKGLQKHTAKMERKHGTFQTGLVYEIVKNNFTRYYIWMQSPKVKLFLSVDNTGLVTVEKTKNSIETTPAPRKEVIAKKN
jgi:uncharacterized protein YbdZ (MbtH family)